MRMKKFLLFLLGLFFFHVSAICQSKTMHEKIDPVLLRLMEEHSKQKTSAVNSSQKCGKKSDVGEKKTFDCIVYTDNAKALRDSGITINSILPTFVTSVATAEQIQKMVAMPFVRYVSASGKNENEKN